jgi:hypothetical protein
MPKDGIAVALAVTLAAGCAGGDAGPVSTRTDSAGVTIVRYDGPDVPLPWTFDSLFSLGGADSGLASFYELRGGVVGADSGGNIYVLDTGAKRIAVFDSLGRDVRAMGGPGGGPGEMEWPIGLVVRPDGRTAAFDIGKRGLVWFGPAGEILEQEPLPAYRGGVGIHSSGPALTFPAQHLEPQSGVATNRLIRVEAGDTAVLASRSATLHSVFFKSCGIGISAMEPIFAPSVRWAAAGDRTAVSMGAEYEVRVFGGPELRSIVRRPLEPVVATADAAREDVGPGMIITTPSGKKTCDTEEVVEQRGFADQIPAIAGIAAGPDGTWWVHRHAGRDGYAFDVFAADGDYVGTLPASAPYPLITMPGGRLGAVVTDELDVDRVVVYRLHRGTLD